MTADDRLAPVAVAVLVIGYLVLFQPLENHIANISMNWIAVLVVAIGGLLGFLR